MRSIVIKFFLPLISICLFSPAAWAAAPANDNLANAATISGASGSTTGTTAEATRETGEYTHTASGSIQVYNTVWYQWTAPASGPVAVTATAGGFDASMAVYTGSAFPLETETINNDTTGTNPRVEFATTAGTTYRIVVGVYEDPNSAGGQFTLQWAQSSAPTNDNFAQAASLTGRSGSVAAANQNATSEPQEPIFGNGNSVWFSYTNQTGTDFSVTFTTANTFSANVDTNLAVYTGTSPAALSTVVKSTHLPTTLKSRTTFLARAGTVYRIAVDAGPSTVPGSIVLSWDVTKPTFYTDFATTVGSGGEIYYDEAADITVFRPSNGVWYSLDSRDGTFRAFQFGVNGDTPAPADYDGDGRTDYAVARSAGGLKTWYIRNSFDGSYRIVQWGIAEDRLVPGDYDDDGRADLGVFRPSTGVWYILRSSDGQLTIRQFGLTGDVPVLGDFKGTGDGTDIAVFRPSNGTWYIFDGVNTIFAPFGASGDKPVPADYDLDGRTDLAVYRPSNGTWYYLASRSDQFAAVQWGLPGDVPMPGDYDNNSNDLADFTVFRPSDNTWYVLRSEGTVTQFTKFGASGDIPVSSMIP
ncbi:MAG: hypothetical protein JSS81_25320 [Acidobacteria bacterium]|nr:hypothetical protein [Acidobacteriota bacterium]